MMFVLFAMWMYAVVIAFGVAGLAARIFNVTISMWLVLGLCVDVVLLLFIYCPALRHVA